MEKEQSATSANVSSKDQAQATEASKTSTETSKTSLKKSSASIEHLKTSSHTSKLSHERSDVSATGAKASSSKEFDDKTSRKSIKSIRSIPSVRSSPSQREVSLNQLVSDFLPRNINDISNEELFEIVIELGKSINLLRIENAVFESYIRRMDPNLMEDFEDRVSVKSRGSFGLKKLSSLSILSSSARHEPALSVLETGPRINLTSKSSIVEEETKIIQQKLNEFHLQMEIAHADIKAAEEEATILTQETLEATNRFERMCTYAVDPVTGRIPAEKFVRYMREWLKIAESTIEKLRLHTNTMHQNIRQMKRELRECRDLGYTIQPIDFDQMKIENRLLKETLNMKNKHLLELKKLSGQCSLVLVQHKKKLMQLESQVHKIAEQIDIQNGKINTVNEECELTKHKLQTAEPNLMNLREFIHTHECPSVMEYMKKIDEVNQLRQEINKWTRRHCLQSIHLKANLSVRISKADREKITPCAFKASSKKLTETCGI